MSHQSPKRPVCKTPTKSIEDVCRLCSENFKLSKTNKHRLFRGSDPLDKAEFTVVLEEFVGKLQNTSLAICTSCRTLLMRYNSVSREAARLKLHIKDMCSKTREKRCAPSTITHEPKKRVSGFCSERHESVDLPSPDANIASSSVPNSVSSVEVSSSPDVTMEQTWGVKRPMKIIVNNISMGRYRALAKNLMKVPGQSQRVIDEVLKQVEKECKFLTSNKFNSLVKHSTSLSHLADFKCEMLLAEWKTAAPIFTQFLKCASAATGFTKHRTEGAKLDERRSWSRKKPEVAMAGLILLKARWQFMASHMNRNSLVLSHDGAKKRFSRLCVNESATLKKIQEIAETWDAGFLEWKKVMCESPGLDDTSWIDEPACSSYFLSDHTYYCQEGQVETVIVDTSSDESEESLKNCVLSRTLQVVKQEVLEVVANCNVTGTSGKHTCADYN